MSEDKRDYYIGELLRQLNDSALVTLASDGVKQASIELFRHRQIVAEGRRMLRKIAREG